MLILPYELSLDFEGFYSFITTHGLKYTLYCVDSNEIFGFDGNVDCVVFHFGISLETKINSIPHDPRIEATAVAFIAAKLESNKNCIIYAGSIVGGKQKVRIRLFEWWFLRANHKFQHIEKYYRQMGDESSVMLICKDCAHKEGILRIFQS